MASGSAMSPITGDGGITIGITPLIATITIRLIPFIIMPGIAAVGIAVAAAEAATAAAVDTGEPLN